jgi:hypothetical protein
MFPEISEETENEIMNGISYHESQDENNFIKFGIRRKTIQKVKNLILFEEIFVNISYYELMHLQIRAKMFL